jgi:L-methionine (R)-S-oxide reductase
LKPFLKPLASFSSRSTSFYLRDLPIFALQKSDMAESIHVTGTSKTEKYESLLPQLNSLVEGEHDFIANLSNIMAALKFTLDFFWVGIYFVKDKQLVLGPFQGPVACTRISMGKGVCGKCWESKKTILVEDVDQFPGHIACSSLSRSEIVLPALDKNGEVFLILDVDSEHLSYFDETDKKYLEQVMQLITKCAALQHIH